MFINREEELKILGQRFQSGKPEFLVLYGRRRVGKSELLEHFLKTFPGVRFLAREESLTLQLRALSQTLSNYFQDPSLLERPFVNWDSVFNYVREKARERFFFALDEFPYLVYESGALPSILQAHWDTELKHSQIFLILSGSSIAMMEKIMGGKSPLYGRRTGQILLKPFTFGQALRHFNRDIENAVRAFSVFGGTPAYLLEYDRKKDLYANIEEKILHRDAWLLRDIEFLLREELREPRYYFSILSSISRGNTKASDIINDTGLPKGVVGKYLSVLLDLQLIERTIPVTEKKVEGRKGLYRLLDSYFRFWFRFVYPNLEYVERGEGGYLIDNEIRPEMDQFVSLEFERIAKEFLIELNKKDGLPFRFGKIGRWWYKDKEIDLVAFNEKSREIFFCEVKWRKDMNAKVLYNELKEKAEHVRWHNEKRKEYFCLIAKSFKNKAEECLQFDLRDLQETFLPAP